MLRASVICLTLVLKSSSVAGPEAYREECVCGTGLNVAMTQKDTEGEFTAHLLSFIAHQHYLCGFS